MAEQPTSPALPDVAKVPGWYRIAAAMLWANPAVTHAEIAKKVGRTRQAVSRAMHTPGMKRAIDEAGGQYSNQLVVAAHRGLLQAFAKGRGAGTALRILQGRKILPTDRLEVTGADGEPLMPADITAEIRAYAAKLGNGKLTPPAAPEQTPPEVADPETQDGTRSEPGA